MRIELPNFENTEEAVRFGQNITRDQLIFLAGARAALKREYDRLRLYSDNDARQECIELATDMGKIREAMEAAPDAVLMSLIGTGIVLNGVDPEVEPASPPIGDFLEELHI